jgi:hypothetical protein
MVIPLFPRSDRVLRRWGRFLPRAPAIIPAVLPAPGELLAHPLTQEGALRVSPLVAAVAAGILAGALALLWPARGKPSASRPGLLVDSWEGTLTTGQVAIRSLSVALVVLAVAAGRLGSQRELENLVPALVVGVAWPGLLVLSATLGPVWRWLDPWDGVARAVAGEAEDRPGREDVRLAVVVALAWAWYLGAYPEALSPRAVGLALGVYTFVTVAGCLAFGRSRWLSRVEVFGVLFGWLARLPRGLLPSWSPPAGASLLLGALAGGLVFGEIRRTELWGELNVVPGALLWSTMALVASAAVGGLVISALGRWASREGAAGSVAAAAVPAVASIAVALSLARSRLFTSIQILPSVLADPFGLGWDPFGMQPQTLEAPLAPVPLAVVQLAVLLAGHVAGAVVLARHRPRTRAPGVLALAFLMGSATMTLVHAPGLTHG